MPFVTFIGVFIRTQMAVAETNAFHFPRSAWTCYCSLAKKGNKDYVGKVREKQILLFIFSPNLLKRIIFADPSISSRSECLNSIKDDNYRKGKE